MLAKKFSNPAKTKAWKAFAKLRIAENKKLKKQTKAQAYGEFLGWTLYIVEIVPPGQLWINPNDTALKDMENNDGKNISD